MTKLNKSKIFISTLYLFTISIQLLVTSCSTAKIANKKCYNYENVAINGTLVSLPHPNGKGDYWVLKTDPFCTQVSANEELYGPFNNQTEIHLVMDDLYSTYRYLLGREVKVYGELFSWYTGHHLRKILLSVDKIEKIK